MPEPYTKVDDVRKVKLFVWSGDEPAVKLWKSAKFNVVALPSTELLTGLQTGLINAFDTPASIALATQWYQHTPYMLDLKWATFPGALVINKTVWERVDADLRPKLMAAARETAARMVSESHRLDAEAMQAMKKRGLKVITPSQADIDEWDAGTDAIYPQLRGGYISAPLFDLVSGAVKKQRALSKP